jgi:hypothetical protein
LILYYIAIPKEELFMKRLAVLSVTAVLFTAACAFGAVQDFGKFTLDIPAGWTARQQGPTAIVQKGENVGFTLTIDATQGYSAKDLINAFAAEFKKTHAEVTEPELDSDGDYSMILTNANGVKSVAMFTVIGDNYMLMVMTGMDQAGNEMRAIMGTLQEK